MGEAGRLASTGRASRATGTITCFERTMPDNRAGMAGAENFSGGQSPLLLNPGPCGTDEEDRPVSSRSVTRVPAGTHTITPIRNHAAKCTSEDPNRARRLGISATGISATVMPPLRWIKAPPPAAR